mmetsp:Transcript_5572/g.15571  ORF Transcript_5572/g.15571 Transcript_5572/m.15571 type:complete len:221 (+) Transcript_5572:2996-3658(+)
MRSRREKAATRDISSEQHLCGPASSYSPCPCPAHAACPSAAAVRGISQSRGSAYHSLCGLLCTAVISGHNNCRLCILQEEGDPRDGVVWIHRDNDAAGDENCELKERQCWSLLDHHAHPRGDQRLSLVLPWRCAEATVAPQLELCDVQQVRCSCDSGGPKLLVCPDLQCTAGSKVPVPCQGSVLWTARHCRSDGVNHCRRHVGEGWPGIQSVLCCRHCSG